MRLRLCVRLGVPMSRDLISWGDLNRRFYAFDADTGKILWETLLGGTISNRTMTYSVRGRQHVRVFFTRAADLVLWEMLVGAQPAPKI